MKNLAIIPARGGSKRIPRKNIKDFLGKPIIAYSIEASMNSGLFDEVMVSTDDEEIKEISIKYGASVPYIRSAENSNDYASTIDVIKEVILSYKKIGKIFNYSCCIYPTAPLIQQHHLKEGFKMLCDKKFDTVFPVVPFGYPIWRGLEIDKNNKTKIIWSEFLNSRSQDLKKVYHDAGQWYWINSSKNIETIFTENSGSIILSEEEVQDIDNLSDWKMAEIKYKLYK